MVSAVLEEVESATVTDVGSTKAGVCASVQKPSRFVGGHPVTGSEAQGPEHANGELFEGATWFLTPSAATEPDRYRLVHGFVSSLGPVAAVGVVGGNRRLPTELPRILASHALLHASERDLYEQAVIEGATRAGLPVTTVPATGKLFDHASGVLGVALEPALAALGKSIGPPWQKDHKEATAAGLVALEGSSV